MRHFIFFILVCLLTAGVNSWAEPFPAKTSDEKAKNKSSKKFENKTDKQSLTFKSLAQVDELTALGVPALALSLLEREQTIRQKYTADWYAFEYKRINLLVVLEHWQPIIDRTQWLLDTATPEKQITKKIRYWFETQQIIARLHLNQQSQALAQLQRLLWQSKSEDRDPSLVPVWRRLVIRAFLQMNNHDDARRALVKYERDYQADTENSEWLLLQAQVLMKTERPQQAIPLLKKLDSHDAKALLLLAELRKNPKEASKINSQIQQQLSNEKWAKKKLNKFERWDYVYVAYESAKVLSDINLQIEYAETLVMLDAKHSVFGDDIAFSVDDLWQLYQQKGLLLANEKSLLVGFNDKWLSESIKILESKPQDVIALNAALISQEKNLANQRRAHKLIALALEKKKQGLALIKQLYLHSSKVTDISILPDDVRYRLVDFALSLGGYADALKIMQTLKQPPEGKSDFEWRMRKARILILQGDYQQSEKIIRQTMLDKNKSKKKTITSDELDRYIQVVFDFQTVQQHEKAISLFNLISFESLSEKLQREIYFWKAESYFSLKKFDLAGLNYLSSARAVANEGNDLWAQAARFKAAESLVKAEIYDDAETIYRELLQVTDNESRKALIKQNLQKIQLLKSVEKTE